MNFATRKGFFTSEFWGAMAANVIGLLPLLQGSGNPLLIGISAAISMLYNHSRYSRKKETLQPGFTDRAGLITSEFLIAIIYLGSGFLATVLGGAENSWVILIGLAMTAIHNEYRRRLKSALADQEVEEAMAPEPEPEEPKKGGGLLGGFFDFLKDDDEKESAEGPEYSNVPLEVPVTGTIQSTPVDVNTPSPEDNTYKINQ